METARWLKRAVVRGGGCAVLAWTLYMAASPPEDAGLSVEIVDHATGKTVPAMVCITSLEDGKWRTPPDGTVAPPYSTVRDFYNPKPWKPGDIGPVRLTNGEYHDNDKRSFVYRGDSVYPFWKEAAAYFVARPFTMRLPTGKWRLAVARGLEYLPYFEEFMMAPGQQRHRKVSLRRWVNMPARGWYSGDDHVHHPRTTPEHNEFLMTWARAEDVHVVNILRMGDAGRTYFEQAGYGKDSRYRQDDYILVSGQEDPRDRLGHVIALNLTAPVRDTSQYNLYDFMFDGAHAQGALTGYAHVAWEPPLGTSIDTIRDKVDFFEILQFRRLGMEDYYEFLGLGRKLTASAGSDLPWGNSIGEVRTYAYTGREFSADAWFDAVKAGRTFVSNGPMLLVTVNDALPGGELTPARNGSLRIRAQAWAPEAMGSPLRLEIVANGRVIRSLDSKAPRQEQLRLDFTTRAESSQWIAARVTTRNQGMAHTSPVYVLPGGERFWNRPDLPALVTHRLQALDALDDKLAAWNSRSAMRELVALKERIQQARSDYRKLLAVQ